jgi:phytoene desaturase
MKIVIIGSGFGGLAAGIRLRAAGHDVTIVEARDKPGGRAYVYEQDGFVFDAGPTILTAPALIDELFAVAGKRLDDSVSLVPLDPFYRVRFEDGSVFSYNGKEADTVGQIRQWHPPDVDGYLRFRNEAARIFETGMALIDQPFTRFRDMVRVAPNLVRLRADRSVAALVDRHIADPRLKQVFSFHPLLVGGNPFQTTSIYALIHTLEQQWGVWYAMGGTGALVRALAALFTSIGGVLELGCEVREIAIDSRTGRADAVLLADNERIPADIVVSNADVAYTYMSLISSRYRRHNSNRSFSRKQYSMSLFVIYFGTDRQYPDMAHHEILMGARYEGLLDDIFNRQRLGDQFSLYLHRPTATDPSLAPAGCDSWYVLAPVPNLGGDTDWQAAAGPYRDAIMTYLETRYLPDLSRHIVTERRIDPRHFRDTLHSYLGSAFSLAPVLTQSAWFRPHNRSEDIANLYFVGAGTHPGAGVPGVLSSGKIVANMIAAAYGN